MAQEKMLKLLRTIGQKAIEKEANTSCFWIHYQPALPESVKKLLKEEKK